MKRFLSAPLLLLLAGPAFGQSDDEIRNAFRTQFGSACFDEQRKAAANARMSDEFLKGYCACFTDRLPETISIQEMRQIVATGGLTPVIQSRLTALGKSCFDRVRAEGRIPPGNAGQR